MPRPHKHRCIWTEPAALAFKPRGVPASALQVAELGLDELEAVRLADLEGLYHEAAAAQMGVSRATFGRLVSGARRTIAEALVHGRMLVVKGGTVVMMYRRNFVCADCGNRFSVPYGAARPGACPACQSRNFHRAPEERGGPGRGRGRGGRGRWGRRRGVHGGVLPVCVMPEEAPRAPSGAADDKEQDKQKPEEEE